MKQIFTYPDNLATNYIDPLYVGDANSGLTRRVNGLLDGTYKSWSNLTPTINNVTAEQTLSKFINYLDQEKNSSNLTMYDFWNTPLVLSDKTLIADDVSISSADTLIPATITTATTHDFEDGWLIRLEDFDGTWGLFYSNKDLYAKRISDTELQVARDSGLTDIIGFTQEEDITFQGGELSYLNSLNVGSVRIDFSSANITPQDGSRIVFNTIQEQGDALIGNTYYLYRLDDSFIYSVYKNSSLTDPLRFDDIAPLPLETSLTMTRQSNPATITTSVPLDSDHQIVSVNTPKRWNNYQSYWGNSFYYLDPTGNPNEYHVYTDPEKTQALNWDLDMPIYFDFTTLQLSGLDSVYITASMPDFIQAENGDPITFNTIGYNGVNLNGNTYYLQYYQPTPGLSGQKQYIICTDTAATVPLTREELGIGNFTVSIPPIENGQLRLGLEEVLYGPNGWSTRAIAAEDNPDWNITAGDDFEFVEYNGGRSPVSSGNNLLEAVPFDLNDDPNTEVLGYSNDIRFWANLSDHPRLFDPTDLLNVTKVSITSVEGNGQDLVGRTLYLSPTGLIEGDRYLCTLNSLDGSFSPREFEDFTTNTVDVIPLLTIGDPNGIVLSPRLLSGLEHSGILNEPILDTSGTYTYAAQGTSVHFDRVGTTLYYSIDGVAPFAPVTTDQNTTIDASNDILAIDLLNDYYSDGDQIEINSVSNNSSGLLGSYYVSNASGSLYNLKETVDGDLVTGAKFDMENSNPTYSKNFDIEYYVALQRYVAVFDEPLAEEDKKVYLLNAGQDPVGLLNLNVYYLGNINGETTKYTLHSSSDRTDDPTINYGQTTILDIYNPNYIAQMPVGEGVGNTYIEPLYDDSNTIILNDQNNEFFGAFTVDDDFDFNGLPVNVGGNITAVTTALSGSLPTPIFGNKQVTSVDNQVDQFYYLNGKRLYKFIDSSWPAFNVTPPSDLDEWNGTLDSRHDPAGADIYLPWTTYPQIDGDPITKFKPYVFYNNSRPDIGVKLFTDEWIMMNVDNWDYKDTEGNYSSGFNQFTNYYNDTVTVKTEMPATGHSATFTNEEFKNIFGINNITGVDDVYVAPDYIPVPNGLADFNQPYGLNFVDPPFGSSTFGGNEIYTQNGVGGSHPNISNTEVDLSLARFTIPEYKRETMSGYHNYRPYTNNSNELMALVGYADTSVNGANPYYNYFKNGDIIDVAGVSYMMIKMRIGDDFYSQYSTLNDDSIIGGNISSQRLIGGISTTVYSWDNYNTHRNNNWVNTRSYTAEEWVLYPINNAPTNTVGLREKSLELFSVLRQQSMAEYSTAIFAVDYTGNITQGPKLPAAPSFPSGSDQGTLSLAMNYEVYPYNTGTVNVTTPETVSDAPVSVGLFDPKAITMTRTTNSMDEMLWKPWTVDNGGDATIKNDPRDSYDSALSPLWTGSGTATIGMDLFDSTTGTVSLSANQPLPYKLSNSIINLPGNKSYSYQDTNNNKVYAAQIDQDSYWEPGDLTETNYTDTGEIIPNISVSVNGSGYLQGVSLVDAGRFHNNEQIMTPIVNLPSTYVPVAPTPSEQQDIWDTDDEWVSAGYSTRKEWPRHVSPASATVNLNTPSITATGETGIKFSRSSGFTKWTLDVEYPPMTYDEFQEFHAIALAAQGQAIPFYFVLRNKDGDRILWGEWYNEAGTTTRPILREDYVAGDTALLLEGFSSFETDAFKRGEIFVDGDNQNGNLHTVLNTVDANVFGEAKIRLPMPLRQAKNTGQRVFKNPYHAIVTMSSDDFEYRTDTSGYYYMSVSFSLDGFK